MPAGFLLPGLAMTCLEAPIAPNACSGVLFNMSPGQLKLVIDSIVWAFWHTERNVADTGACTRLHAWLI